MPSPAELHRFLDDLGNRRDRLLALVGPPHGDPALIDELTELAEQLIVAEEELRVQQEELAAARQQVEQLVSAREQLLDASAEAGAFTDHRGVLLRANRAAMQLISLPANWATPRPIVTWFEVADRAAVRTAISRVTSGHQATAEFTARLRRADRSPLPVRVSVTGAPQADPDRTDLQWLFTVDSPPEAAAPSAWRMHMVTEPAPSAEPELSDGARAMVSQLADLAAELATSETVEELLDVAVRRARQLVPGASGAGVLLAGRHGPAQPAAWTDSAVGACELRQAESRQGPALTALAQGDPVLIADTSTDPHWPEFCRPAAELGISSVLSVPFGTGGGPLGVLSLYAEQPARFDQTAAFIASKLAVHLAAALTAARTVQNLRIGMANRELIGEAVGVLMERRRITREDAFLLLVQASQHSNIKLREVARIVAETGQDPGQATVR